MVRTVSEEIDSTTSSSTSRSAIVRMVQSAASAGASEHAILTIMASAAPVTFGSTGGAGRGLRSKAPMGPASQARLRNRSSGRIDRPLSWTVFESGKAGPAGPMSMASMAFARCTLIAEALPLRASLAGLSRSSASSLM